MCLHYQQLPCYVWQWRVFTRWKHQYVSALRTVAMLRMTVGIIHQMATSVCVCGTNSYHVTFDSGEYSPNGNISMCLRYEQLPCYVWQWRVFTKWQHQYVSAVRTVTMLRLTVESIHQMATSVCVWGTNSYHVTFDSGEYSPNGNISMCLQHEQLPCYVWQWIVFTRWKHQYVSAVRTVTILRMTVESIHQMATSVCVWGTNSYHVTYDSVEYSPDCKISMCLHYEHFPRYVWQWRVFTWWQHQYIFALRTVTMLRMAVTGTLICLVQSRCLTVLKNCDVYLQFTLFCLCAQLLLCGRTCTGQSHFSLWPSGVFHKPGALATKELWNFLFRCHWKCAILVCEQAGQNCVKLEVLNLVIMVLCKYYFRSSVFAMNFINNLFTYVY